MGTYQFGSPQKQEVGRIDKKDDAGLMVSLRERKQMSANIQEFDNYSKIAKTQDSNIVEMIKKDSLGLEGCEFSYGQEDQEGDDDEDFFRQEPNMASGSKKQTEPMYMDQLGNGNYEDYDDEGLEEDDELVGDDNIVLDDGDVQEDDTESAFTNTKHKSQNIIGSQNKEELEKPKGKSKKKNTMRKRKTGAKKSELKVGYSEGAEECKGNSLGDS